MANDTQLDPQKARLFQLNFRKQTQGLSPEEEQELADLKQKLVDQAKQNNTGG